MPNSRSNSRRLRVRSARPSLSIFDATTCNRAASAEVPPRLEIGRKAGVSGIDQQKDRPAPLARGHVRRWRALVRGEIGVDDGREFLLGIPAAARVAVSRQIDEVDAPRRQSTLAAFGRHPVDVGMPGLTGRGTGPRERAAHQCVQQARFADIRSSEKRELRKLVAQHAVSRPTGRRAGDKVGAENLHDGSLSAVKIRGSAAPFKWKHSRILFRCH